jgi:hypothetical protein
MASVGFKWSDEEEKQLLEEIKKGMKYTDIAILHNRTEGAISSRLRHIAYKLYLNNTTLDDISYMTKIEKKDIEYIIKQRSNMSNKKRYKEHILTKNEDISTETSTTETLTKELNILKSDVAEIKKDVKEILRLINAIYEFEQATDT